jgi:monomeric isocitrate dehydrogenase
LALLVQIKKLPGATKEAVLKDIDACYEERPWLAMVDSGKGELLVLWTNGVTVFALTVQNLTAPFGHGMRL